MGKKKIAEQTQKRTVGGKEAVTPPPEKGMAPRKTKKVERGRVYINASYNNTVITVTDAEGNVRAWASAGSLGFSGPKKATPFASSKVISAITEKLKATGPTTIDVIIKGVGGGRDSAIRSLVNQGFAIASMKDVTPIPHNGPRPPKVRRV